MIPNNRILVVDDNLAIHDDLRRILDPVEVHRFSNEEAALFGIDFPDADEVELPRFDVESATQGQQAFALVEQSLQNGRPFAAAFVDVRMPPGWSGIETIERCWSIDPRIEVVICTAYSDYSWQDIVRRLGRTDRFVILKKPFDVVEVRQLANSLTMKWNLKRAQQQQTELLERVVEMRSMELRALQQSSDRLPQESVPPASGSQHAPLVQPAPEASQRECIDADSLLARCFGDTNTMVELLQMFCDKLATDAHLLGSACDSRDRQLLRSTAHSLKGVAANLSATQLQQFAAQVDMLCRDELTAFERVVKDVSALREEMCRCLCAVPPLIESLSKHGEQALRRDNPPFEATTTEGEA